MKQLAILAAGLLLATSAYAASDGRIVLAQNQKEQQGTHEGGQHGGGPPHGGGMMQHGGGMMQNEGVHHGQKGMEEQHRIGPMEGGPGMQMQQGMGAHYQGGGPAIAHPSYQHDSRGFGIRPQNWNNRPRNFDRRDYQRNFRAAHPFHWGQYHRPPGWYYRRWVFGEILPAIFWTRDYWIDDFWMFDLPIPPFGYEWVRYGNDALLINTYTGEILEVEYGVFD